MYGISSSGKEAIAIAIEKMFDSLSYKLLGNIPKVREKSPFFSAASKLSLTHIFVQALGGRELSQFEKDVLKSILNSSHGYIESLKYKTRSQIVESIDALVKEAKAKKSIVSASEVSAIIAVGMLAARNHMKTIAEAETTKTRNLGHAMEIVSRAKEQGIEDPTVFFIVLKDNLLCSECKRLHLMSDGITPRTWKMSELSMGWHKRSDMNPSACGEHPGCRCTLVQLSEGWGFKKGAISFIGLDHDEHSEQKD